MQEAYSVYQKKRFIRWFLDTYELKNPRAAKILNFIANDDELLQKVYFVEDVRRLPNALIVSSADASTVSFLCRISDVYYEDIDELIDVLRAEPPEELFVRLSFNREFLCFMCETVLDLKPEVGNKMFYYQVIRTLEDEINRRIYEKGKSKELLMTQIDKALSAGDRDLFQQLSEKYRQLCE